MPTKNRPPKMDLTSGVDDEDVVDAPAGAPPEEDEPLVKLDPASLAMNAPQDPLLPGFEMSDEPIPTPDAQKIVDDYAADQQTSGTTAQRSYIEETNRRAHGIPDVKSGEIIPPKKVAPPVGSVVYESRIRILEAWQYPGHVPKTAPDYIDRNWIGWADPDPLRVREGEPCLRVPIENGQGAAIVCRPGDFVVRQEVQMAPGYPSTIKIEVWEEEQFARLFIATDAPQPSDKAA